MSDSVDRVFVHALNTVKKLPRTGSARPPPADRLQLYGLYKQSMEGDVDRVMDRPLGEGEEIQAERSKWDAWYQQKGLPKTEAKRRYISTLIETMNKYASTTPDARELVSELEFVWDQIKSNTVSSSSSSPIQIPGLRDQPPIPPSYTSPSGNGPLRVVRPTSQDDDDEANEDRYDDARDGEEYGDRPTFDGRRSGTIGHARGHEGGEEEVRNRKWRRRVEQAIVKMTAEVAALREQLESNRLYGARRRRSMWDWLLWLILSTLKHAFIDAVLLAIALLWLRRKRDKRLEQALMMAVGIVREKARRLKFPKR